MAPLNHVRSPLMSKKSPSHCRSQGHFWMFRCLRGVFWLLQVGVLLAAWWQSADWWSGHQAAPNPQEEQTLSGALARLFTPGGELIPMLMLILWGGVLRSRRAIDRQLREAVQSIVSGQMVMPWLLEPWYALESYTCGYVTAFFATLVLVLLDGMVYSLGFGSVFFGDGYDPLARTLGVLMVLGMLADLSFDWLVARAKKRAGIGEWDWFSDGWP